MVGSPSVIHWRAMSRKKTAHCLIALITLNVTFPSTVLADDTEQMMRDRISFHDQQEFELAIELFTQDLKFEPRNGTAAYELAYTHQASGIFDALMYSQ